MEKFLNVKFGFDITTIRKAYVMITGEMITDEEIKEKFTKDEPKEVDCSHLSEVEKLQFCVTFLALILADDK